MKCFNPRIAIAMVIGFALGLGAVASVSAAKAQKGGILQFVVAGESPSKDGHRETTYATIHPYAPMYSVLIRVNPDDPQSSDFVCDLCKGKVPKPTEGDTKYTFKLVKGVKFHDGTPLTAHDVVATYKKIIFPPQGIPSARKAFFKMVESVTAPDNHTVVFKLKFPSGAFLPALATPYNWIYAKKDLDEHGYNWHRDNVNGSGPFMFVQHQPGALVEGKRNPNYHHKGQPYLDGFKALVAKKMSVRIQAIRGNRAAIEFRGFPPKARDDLVNALGDKLKVQESDWNCSLLATPNHKRKPFDDARVRRALTLAVNRWEGSKYLSKIAIVKTVGGAVFPGHPLAATKEELTQLAGYGTDIEKARKEARQLLVQAGVSNLTIDYNNRDVDQPYKVVGTWLIDQWKQVGLNVKQTVRPTPQFYANLRKSHENDVSIDFNCQSVVNPIADVSKFLCSAGNNYSQCEDPELEAIYDKLLRAASEKEQRSLMRQYEKRALDEQAIMGVTLWWYKINPHRAYVKGWKIAPSHYLNQQLDNVWLDQSMM
ncbi:MAG: ABC transporter substrate-binding protein [Gammaproteobacteria bacterium]|nr:ABC transporter substrate-binding protein [Gammaproteobacteria bacterium]